MIYLLKLIKPYLQADSEHYYEEYYIEDYTWNGFEVSYFTKEVADQVVSDVNESNKEYLELFYDKDNNCYKCIDKQYIDEDNPHQNKEKYTTTFDTSEFSIDNKKVTLYGIGVSYWTWSICDPKEFKQIKF